MKFTTIQCNTKNGLSVNYLVFAKMQTRTCHLVEVLSPTPWYCFWWSVWFRNHMLHSAPEKEQNSQCKVPGGRIYPRWGAYLTAKTIHSNHHLFLLLKVPRSAEGVTGQVCQPKRHCLCSILYPKKASAARLVSRCHWISACKMKWLKYPSSCANHPWPRDRRCACSRQDCPNSLQDGGCFHLGQVTGVCCSQSWRRHQLRASVCWYFVLPEAPSTMKVRFNFSPYPSFLILPLELSELFGAFTFIFLKGSTTKFQNLHELSLYLQDTTLVHIPKIHRGSSQNLVEDF